jgi:hypothetical protein
VLSPEPELRIGWPVAIAVAAFGLLWFVFRLAFAPPVDVTDLDRDLIGARAAIEGYSPYQRLGDIESLIPAVEVTEVWEQFWVSHTPLSVGLARLLWVGFGENAEAVAQLGVLLCLGVLLVVPPLRMGLSPPAGLFLGGSLALSAGVALDMGFLQGAALVGVGLLVVFELMTRGHRGLGLAVMSVCVAWRPWCAPLALFLPSTKRPVRDAIWVAAGAVGITLVSVPAIGGFASLGDWLWVATPMNLDENVGVHFNGSLLALPLGPEVSIALLIASVAVLAVFRERVRSQHLTGASLAALAFFPLVWPPHWVGLYPGLLSERTEEDVIVLGTALLLMANPLTTWAGPVVWRAAAAVAIALLTWWWVRSSVQSAHLRPELAES